MGAFAPISLFCVEGVPFVVGGRFVGSQELLGEAI
jgi:hypothetical protein